MSDRVALVSSTPAVTLDDDLAPLTAALAAVGVTADVVVWDDPGVAWSSYRLAVVRSTWDYAHRRDRYLQWAAVVASATTLVNPPAVLAWSTDKRYLADLAAAGVPVVATQWITEPFPPATPPAALGEGWPPGAAVVVKPVVGAGSVGAARFAATDAGRRAAATHAAALVAEGRAVMVQPYQEGIDGAGEAALVFVDGAFSHAITKGAMLAAAPTFVEGGLYAEERIAPRAATAAQQAVAAAALAAAAGHAPGHPWLYARVDLVPGTDGSPLVLELELAEPSLFLAQAEGAAERLAAAIAARVGGSGR